MLSTKTAFCPGPRFGLFHFCRMLFGLTGAPSSFQRLMNIICGDLPFITTYLDDLLIHSKTVQEHKEHLEILFDRISTAGLTLVVASAALDYHSRTHLLQTA